MGASQGSLASASLSRGGPSKDADEDSSSSDDEEQVDRLATASRTGVLLEVMTPRSNCPWHADQSQGAAPKIKNVLGEDCASAKVSAKTVQLHVYDLEEFSGANNVLAFSMDAVTVGGAFHAGVEIYGNEWSYGIYGVRCEAPRCAEGHTYRCTVPLGDTHLSATEVAGVLFELCQKWKGADYDLFSRNCCSFATEFCRRLGSDDFPPWVDRFARIMSTGKGVGQGVVQVGKAVGGMLREAGLAASELVGDAVQGWLQEPTTQPAAHKQSEITPGVTSMQLPDGESAILVKDGKIFMSTQDKVPAIPVFPVSEPIYVSRVVETTSKLPKHKAKGLEQIAEDVEQTFPVGAAVEYESTSHSRWIPTRVLARDPKTGLYDLDCKAQVPAERIRWPGIAALDEPTGLPRCVTIDPAAAGVRPPLPRSATIDMPMAALQPACGVLPVGTSVEYESASHGCWVPAKIVAHYAASGMYDLDVKIQVPRDKIRLPGADASPSQTGPPRTAAAPITLDAGVSVAPPPCPRSVTIDSGGEPLGGSATAQAASGAAVFAVNALVEYHSASAGRWIPATVLACNESSGFYDLDVKTQVAPDRIRPRHAQAVLADGARPLAQTSAPGGSFVVVREVSRDSADASAAGAKYPVGASVEYYSASHCKWVPAKVCVFHAATGLYDLDCRSQASPANIRWPVVAVAQPAAAQPRPVVQATVVAAGAVSAAPAEPKVTVFTRPDGTSSPGGGEPQPAGPSPGGQGLTAVQQVIAPVVVKG